MLKFLSKVVIEYNALDPRKAACVELLAQCNARKAKESNPACVVELHRLPDAVSPPRVVVTYVNGVEEAIDAAATPAQAVRQQILDRGQLLETEQMFREAGEHWPVVIPEEEIHQTFPGTKVCAFVIVLVGVFLSNSLLASPRFPSLPCNGIPRLVDLYMYLCFGI
jgi:large subunit ribosomal protein L53